MAKLIPFVLTAALCMMPEVLRPAHAQSIPCDPQWLPSESPPGINGSIYSSALWDADGVGPLAPSLVVAGSFATWDGAAGTGVAGWDGSHWRALGTGFNGTVWSLVVLPDGALLAGGVFTAAGGNPASNIARFDGTDWSAFGGGVNGGVRALALTPGGQVIAAGDFSQAGSVPASRIASWNGSAWSAMGLGMDGTVYALTIAGNGDVIAGGAFQAAGSVSADKVARWNGTAWSAMGAGVPPAGSTTPVFALTTRANGDILAAGGHPTNFSWMLKRWTGSAWTDAFTSIETGVTGPIYALKEHSNGTLHVGARAMAAYLDGAGVLRRFGGAGFGTEARAITQLPDGTVAFCGTVLIASGNTQMLCGVGVWTGTEFTALGPAFNGPIRAMLPLAGGDTAYAGYFDHAFGTPANGIVLRTPSGWLALGGGITGGGVNALAQVPSGDLITGGTFSAAGGVPAQYIARWNGAAWSAYTPGLNGAVTTLAVSPSGELHAGGSFTASTGTLNHVAKWNGVSWVPLGTGITSSNPNFTAAVSALAFKTDGSLVVGGRFTHAGGIAAPDVAMWTGSGWQVMGAGLPRSTGTSAVNCLLVRPNGEIWAGGTFDAPLTGIARFVAGQWQLVPGSTSGVTSLINAIGGGVVAAETNTVATWNGSAWSRPVGTLRAFTLPAPLGPLSISQLPTGEVHVGGLASEANGVGVGNPIRLGCPGPVCDPIDFNNDGLFPDTADIEDFLSVFSGGPCSTGTCGDIDFNNDGLFPDTLDIDALLSVFSGGPCLL